MSSVDERIKSTGKGLKKKIVSVCKCAALIVKLPSEILINLILGLWITSLTGNPWFTVNPWPSYDSLHISGNLRSLCLKKLKVKWQVEPVGEKKLQKGIQHFAFQQLNPRTLVVLLWREFFFFFFQNSTKEWDLTLCFTTMHRCFSHGEKWGHMVPYQPVFFARHLQLNPPVVCFCI